MKRISIILFLLCAFNLAHPVWAYDLVIQENTVFCIFGDSFMRDGNNTSPQTGGMFPYYAMADFYLENPDKTNVAIYVYARSGGTMNDFITLSAQLGVPSWGFKSNNFPLLGMAQATENGGSTSNQMFLLATNLFAAPLLTTNGTAMTNEGGWSATPIIGWIGLGNPPGNSSDGNTAHQAQDYGMTNAAGLLGFRGIDVWTDLRTSWSNETVLRGGTNAFVTSGAKINHLRAPGEFAWFMSYRRNISSDTNISTCTVDWNGSVVATNHCVVSSASASGGTLTFTRHDYRLPPAFDAPGTDSTGAVITNDCTPAWTLIRPEDANYLHFDLTITNLPAGNYDVTIDGVLCAHNLPDTTLAAGWNMFTNTVGPYWLQRLEVLGRSREMGYLNRSTLIEGNSGDGIGFPGLCSFVGSVWPANHGDTLIAAMNDKIAHLQTNSTASFAAIRAAAQQTNHTFTITSQSPPTPRFAPFRR